MTVPPLRKGRAAQDATRHQRKKPPNSEATKPKRKNPTSAGTLKLHEVRKFFVGNFRFRALRGLSGFRVQGKFRGFALRVQGVFGWFRDSAGQIELHRQDSGKRLLPKENSPRP